jgi:hypothetical protein
VSTESLAVVATGFSVLALLVVVTLTVQVGRLRRAYDGLVAGQDGTTFPSAVARQTAEVRALRADVEDLRGVLGRAGGAGSGALRHVAVVRYDAFADLAGALSFSAALLDDAGDGLVLSSINGRSETRTYAKGVRGGMSETPLSPEEHEAIAGALRPRASRPLAGRTGAA